MIACVHIPYFAAALEHVADPALKQTPLLLVTYGKSRGRITAFSEAAAKEGVVPNLALSRARALCPQATFMTADPARFQAALDGLLSALWTFTHRVEVDEEAFPQSAVCYLDLGRLNAADMKMLTAQIIDVVKQQCGMAARVGVASGKFPAYVAAMRLQESTVSFVPPGEEKAFVSSSSVGLLPLSKSAAHLLDILHIRTLAEFAVLPRTAVISQLGKVGKQLHYLACGLDGRPVKVRRMPMMESCSQRFEHPISDRARLEVMLHGVAHKLTQRLDGRGMAFHQIVLTLHFDSGEQHSERLHLLEPVSNTLFKTLAQLTSRAPLSAAVSGVEVTLAQLVPDIPRQLELFTHKPTRQRILDLVATLAARHGSRCFYVADLHERESLLPERRFDLRQVDAS